MGCARNEVDSEELAGRLAADGWTLVEDVESAEVAVVNTCGFIESAKKDSVDALLEANSLKGHGTTRAVVAVGCMAERYGKELAAALPEADAILGFDDYQDISARLQSIVSGNAHTPHTPRDRRALLPIAPVDRAQARDESFQSAVGAGGSLFRKRLGSAPWAPLKIASGCDRRCSFCAIPYFRGSFVSRRPTEILQEALWLGQNGVSESSMNLQRFLELNACAFPIYSQLRCALPCYKRWLKPRKWRLTLIYLSNIPAHQCFAVCAALEILRSSYI